MLLTIIFVLIMVVGFFMTVKFFDEVWGYVLAIGFLGTLLCVLLIMKTQIPKQTNYEKAVMRRDMLEYRLEQRETEPIGNEMLYSDILEFNQALYSAKKWSKNPWVNWFWNDKIAELDYIDIDKENIGSEQVCQQ